MCVIVNLYELSGPLLLDSPDVRAPGVGGRWFAMMYVSYMYKLSYMHMNYFVWWCVVDGNGGRSGSRYYDDMVNCEAHNQIRLP